MALIFEGSTCALCDELLEDGRPWFATPGGWLPSTDPLWEFHDAGIHWDCFRPWPHRKRFAALYFDTQVEFEAANPYWHLVLQDAQALVQVNSDCRVPRDCGIQPSVGLVHLTLSALPMHFLFELATWERVIREGPPNETEPLVLQAFASARPVFEAEIPTPAHILARVDPERKRPLIEKKEAEIEREEAEHRKHEQLRARCKRVEERIMQVRAEGATCPHCGVHHRKYLGERHSNTLTRIECRLCGHIFDGVEEEPGDGS